MVQIEKTQTFPIYVVLFGIFRFQLLYWMDVLIPQCKGDYCIREQATFFELGI
jgi:hypothetical protein